MSFLFDTSFLTGKIAEIEDSSSADGATLVDIDLFDERRRDGENSFHTDTVGDLTNSKGFSGTASGALKHNALEVLDTFFVTFFDFVMDSDGIASLEFGELFTLDQILYILHQFSFSHDIKF